MTPEGRVKKMVKKALDTMGADCWRFMPVQTGFGTPALDYLLSIRGRFVAIETKAPGKKLTPLQEGTKAAIEAAGGIVLVVWDEGSLAIAMKIVLALEFSPHVQEAATPHLQSNLNAVRSVTGECAFVANRVRQEAQRPGQKHVLTGHASAALDAAVGGDHGAPAKSPQRRAKPDPRRDDQPVTATVTTGCVCASHQQHRCVHFRMGRCIDKG